MDLIVPSVNLLRERLLRKLSSVHARLDLLNGNKDKLHQVLHAAYRPGDKTLHAARQRFIKMTGIAPETPSNIIPQLLATKELKQLQNIDRLVKPDPRIYIYQGKPVSFDDIKSLGRSPIEREIQNNLRAINLSANPNQLTHDLETYGFAIIDTTDTEKQNIETVFQQAKTYLKETDLSDKEQLTYGDPSIDAEYKRAKQAEQKNNGYRSQEHITTPRPYIFDRQYDSQWQEAKASDLRLAFHTIANLLETKSQEVLEHLAKLFKLDSDFFKKVGYETDQSSVRLIHCISEQEQAKSRNKYFDNDSRKGSLANTEPNNSCIGIHTDWGLITLLPTATAPGLEFWYNDTKANGNNSGWVSLKSKPGQLIVMPGNVAEIISGGKLKSVPHRVISSGDRFSLAYFTEVKKDTNIDQLKQNFMDQAKVENKISLFEDEVRPYLVNPEQALTGENYLLYMKHRNTANLNSKTRDYAQKQGLFLKS